MSSTVPADSESLDEAARSSAVADLGDRGPAGK